MGGFLDPSVLPYLNELAENYQIIRTEVEELERHWGEFESEIGDSHIPTYRARNFEVKSPLFDVSKWILLRFYMQGHRFVDFLRKYQFTPTHDNPSPDEVEEFCKKVERFHQKMFPRSTELFARFYEKNRSEVTNIALYVLRSGNVLPLHTNFDPHMYRCHLGVIIPEGDSGIKVEDETRKWEEGKFLILDTLRAHTAWNYAGRSRYVLSVDCFRPEVRREEVVKIHELLVQLRMTENKHTMGMSGGRSYVTNEDQRRYASEREKESARQPPL
jgi:hypothetical protein